MKSIKVVVGDLNAKVGNDKGGYGEVFGAFRVTGMYRVQGQKTVGFVCEKMGWIQRLKTIDLKKENFM